MKFKSYDGWKAVDTDIGEKAIRAHFTLASDDGEIARYNLPTLKRLADKPVSESLNATDKELLMKAIADGPARFKVFHGWKNYKRGKGKPIWVGTMSNGVGKGSKGYNLGALQNMQKNPPPNFSQFDKVLLQAAMDLHPSLKNRQP